MVSTPQTEGRTVTAAVAEPAFVRVSPRDPRYFELTDGRPFRQLNESESSKISYTRGEDEAMDYIQQEPDPFASKALQLLVDGKEPEEIRHILEIDMTILEETDLQAVGFFEGVGGYAPTIGIIGAVLGLIHVMGNLENPALVGPGIAVAFVATIYGVALANLFFLPIASKLRSCVREAARYREMIIEGIIAIADGENPRAIEMRLNGYLA